MRTECEYYYIQCCKILTLLNIKRTLDNTIKAHTQLKKGHVFSSPPPTVPWPMETEKTGGKSETEENVLDMFAVYHHKK